ncbi:uncharacterized protein LOC108847094 isoform X2 [Raphanus sativus]|uniref:Uncharacterized protein LOC108847094 isoform X2 n=1 Tax=Raphanus sativus TaxID=3726 RepID=A0A9W3DET4_RAPSA|nr:uncharacterized protein LOC108847094 isoform X2 [Raphanus sativus]
MTPHNDFVGKCRVTLKLIYFPNCRSHVRTDTERNVTPMHFWRLSFCTSQPWRLVKKERMSRNHKAAPEYANSKTAVWWDMDTCPVPDGYDAGRVRPSIEGALKELGYYGPVTITAMGNLKEAPPHLLQRLSSTGILVQHAIPDWVATLIFSDVMEFKRNNPPPATIMLISDKVDRELSFRLCRNQQIQRGYNLVRARSFCGNPSRLYHTADWRWKTILEEAADSVSQDTTTSSVLRKCSSSVDSSALSSFVCRACKFTGLSVASFTSHLSTEEHEPYPHLLVSNTFFSLSNYFLFLSTEDGEI